LPYSTLMFLSENTSFSALVVIIDSYQVLS
jgi:hypothetical protein